MKLLAVVVIGLLIMVNLLAGANAQEEAATPQDVAPDPTQQQMENISYGVGFYPGNETRMGLKVDGLEADLDLVVRGFADALRGTAPMVPEEQLDAVLTSVEDDLEKRISERLIAADPEFRKVAEENLQQSNEFHDAFGKKEGVVTLPDGLQYLVIKPGTGASPTGTDTVVINLRMMLTDGTELGYWPGAKLRVDKLLEGGAKVLSKMKVGAKWATAVPPDLAYGTAGRYPDIGPNQTVLFGVELLEVE